MSKSREAIESNLQTMKSAIDDYDMTPDSIDFTTETAKLKEDLLKMALKYHILTDRDGSKELREAVKQQDPDFATELKALAEINKKGGKKYLAALKELDIEVAAETISTMKKLGGYKLSQEELTKLAAETITKINTFTKAFKEEITKDAAFQAKMGTSRSDTPAPDRQKTKARQETIDIDEPAQTSAAPQPSSPTSTSRVKPTLQRRAAVRGELHHGLGVFEKKTGVEQRKSGEENHTPGLKKDTSEKKE